MAEGLARALDEMARRDVDVLVLGREGNARFVSEATRLFAGPDLAFEDRGVHSLKGLDGEWRLSAFVQERERA